MKALERPPTGRADVEAYLWTRYAGVYDRSAMECHLDEYLGDTIARRELPLARARAPQSPWLDVGCGFGSFVIEARKNGIDARGVDIEPFEIEYARERSRQLGKGREWHDAFQPADAHALPFPDETFHLLTFWSSLEHIPDVERTLREAARVLKPGGRVIALCPNYGAIRREAHYGVLWWPRLRGETASRYLRRRGRDPTFFENSINPVTYRELRTAMLEAGLLINDLTGERWRNPETIVTPGRRRILLAAKRLRILDAASFVFRAVVRGPLRGTILLEGVKPA